MYFYIKDFVFVISIAEFFISNLLNSQMGEFVMEISFGN